MLCPSQGRATTQPDLRSVLGLCLQTAPLGSHSDFCSGSFPNCLLLNVFLHVVLLFLFKYIYFQRKRLALPRELNTKQNPGVHTTHQSSSGKKTTRELSALLMREKSKARCWENFGNHILKDYFLKFTCLCVLPVCYVCAPHK